MNTLDNPNRTDDVAHGAQGMMGENDDEPKRRKQKVAITIPQWVVWLSLIAAGVVCYYAYQAYRDHVIETKINAAYHCEDGCEGTLPGLVEQAKEDCFHGDYYNCQDFSSHRQAQDRYKLCKVVTGRDVHHLDGDNDGSACESL